MPDLLLHVETDRIHNVLDGIEGNNFPTSCFCGKTKHDDRNRAQLSHLIRDLTTFTASYLRSDVPDVNE